jgi:hypothetical protein
LCSQARGGTLQSTLWLTLKIQTQDFVEDKEEKFPLQIVANHDKFLLNLCVNMKEFAFLSVQTTFSIIMQILMGKPKKAQIFQSENATKFSVERNCKRLELVLRSLIRQPCTAIARKSVRKVQLNAFGSHVYRCRMFMSVSLIFWRRISNVSTHRGSSSSGSFEKLTFRGFDIKFYTHHVVLVP